MKAEIRYPKSEHLPVRQKPKSEIRIWASLGPRFGLPSNFGFRVSAFLLLLACASFLFPWALRGQRIPQAPFITRSQSGQFIIHAGQVKIPFAPGVNLDSNTNYVRFDAARLTVSCERVKEVLWHELGATAPWQSKIHLYLHAAHGFEETISITSEQFKDGWQYGVYLPDVVERARYARALVQVLLLEMANRNAQTHSAEVPLWLTEGLTQVVLADRLTGLVPPPPGRARKGLDGLNIVRTSDDIKTNQPLAHAHEQLQLGRALTFDELSWPNEDQLSGRGGEIYRSSAHLLVGELANLQDGRACLRKMIEDLPSYYNWQFAFLRAFQGSFSSQLEVEKWWALRFVKLMDEQQLTHTWPLAESCQKLDQALVSPIQIRTRSNELPLRGEATLQTILREWDGPKQTQALRSKITELTLLRLRAAPDVAVLAEEYRQTIENFLQSPIQAAIVSKSGKTSAVSQTALDTIKRLDALDLRRDVLRRSSVPVAAAQSQIIGDSAR
jgi:hypothetical protein